MKALLMKANKKLGGQLGETIGETLVALLISALALTMLAGAITASGNVVMTGRRKLNRYYAERDVVMLMNSGSVTPTSGQMVITESTDSPAHSQRQDVLLYKSDETFGDKQIAAYKINMSTSGSTSSTSSSGG